MKKLMVLLLTMALMTTTVAMAGPGDRSGRKNAGRSCQYFDSYPGCDNDGPGPRHGMRSGKRGGRGHKAAGFGGLLRHAETIGLSDKQVDDIQSATTAFRKEMVDYQADLKKAEIDLKALMRDSDTNEGAVLTSIDKVAGLRAQVQKQRFLHHAAIKKMLTPEQLDKMKELRSGARDSYHGDVDFFDQPGHGRSYGWSPDED